jgi:hypothetical protein
MVVTRTEWFVFKADRTFVFTSRNRIGIKIGAGVGVKEVVRAGIG